MFEIRPRAAAQWLLRTARAVPRAGAGAALERPAPTTALPRLQDPPGEAAEPSLVYHGSRPGDQEALADLSAQARISVVVISADGVAPLRHYPYHSPGGFEWGYSGSGPADLARCILLHHFDVTPLARNGFYPPRPDGFPVAYQDFKAEVVSLLPRDRAWSLSTGEVSAWVEAHR